MKPQKKIQPNMSDKERAKIIKGKTFTVVHCDTSRLNVNFPSVEQTIKRLSLSDATRLLKKIGEEFGVFHSYFNPDLAIGFSYSGKSLTESIHKQNGQLEDYPKLLSCLSGVIENAVGIEAHIDRYKSDRTLDESLVLVGGFSDGNNICPVKLEVKHFNDGTENKLHVAITKTELKKADVVGRRFGKNPDNSNPRSASDISIRQFVKKVNTTDGDLLKYFPETMLTRPQRRAADDARVAEAVYTERKLAERQAKLAVRGKENPTGAGTPGKPTETAQAPLAFN